MRTRNNLITPDALSVALSSGEPDSFMWDMDQAMGHFYKMVGQIDTMRGELGKANAPFGSLTPLQKVVFQEYDAENIRGYFNHPETINKEYSHIDHWAKVYDTNLPIAQANDEAIKANQVIFQKITSIYLQLGFGKTVRARARRNSNSFVTNPASWYTALEELATPYLTPANQVAALDKWWATVRKFRVEIDQAKEAEARDLERTRIQVRENMERGIRLVVLGRKYNSEVVSPDEVMDVLLDQNAWLFVYEYLRQNRNDWSDGFDMAHVALSKARVAKLDPKFITDLQDALGAFDDDGRIFIPYMQEAMKRVPGDLWDDYEKALVLGAD